ncbi:MAG: hypothetical protein GY927_19205 [bacterium]|nr:hypothetical protein [bacterium]
MRKNMKYYLLPLCNKPLIRKLFLVGAVFGVLKSDMGLEHSRHRSSTNALVHIISCLVAHCLKNNKPEMTLMTKQKLEAYQLGVIY